MVSLHDARIGAFCLQRGVVKIAMQPEPVQHGTRVEVEGWLRRTGHRLGSGDEASLRCLSACLSLARVSRLTRIGLQKRVSDMGNGTVSSGSGDERLELDSGICFQLNSWRTSHILPPAWRGDGGVDRRHSSGDRSLFPLPHVMAPAAFARHWCVNVGCFRGPALASSRPSHTPSPVWCRSRWCLVDL